MRFHRFAPACRPHLQRCAARWHPSYSHRSRPHRRNNLFIHHAKIPFYIHTQSAQMKYVGAAPTHNLPNETVGAVPMCPPERPRSGVSIPKIHALCAGDERWMRPCGATRAGTQAPPLPISIIFFHAIPYKQNSVHAQFTPNEINRPCAIRPYPSPPNHAVCPYPIGVILSIAQGWQVQRSLPWVTMQARRLPPWGLYFFSSHIITTRGEWIIRE